MKIAVIGTGYVGLVAGTCFAESGNDVICVDIDQKKIDGLNDGIIPIYEPGLEELVKRNVEEDRLKFTTEFDDAVQKSLIIFIAVGTPSSHDGKADLKFVQQVAKSIGQAMNGYKIIVDKSTVPVGTADMVKDIISKETDHEYNVVSNPEFLKEGAAIDDFMKPDRVVIGTDDVRVGEIMRELYNPFVRTGHPIIVMDVRSAEMTKYAANAMLATRISFMNEIARLCERAGADVDKVREGISTDSRIGPSFLFPGLGYGGSCFPKDIRALFNTAKEHDLDFKILKAVDVVNDEQKTYMIPRIIEHYGGDIKGKTFALWGLAFKPNTDDMREAPAIFMIEELLKHGANVHATDPEAIERTKEIFGDKVKFFKKNYDALGGADALLIITEWNEFRRPDYDKIKDMLSEPVIFDGRNIYNPERMKEMGFKYYSVGRQPV